MRLINLTNKKIGKLTVLKRYPPKKGEREAIWESICECGNRSLSRTSQLTRGIKNSCGCLLTDWRKNFGSHNKLPKGEAGFNKLFKRYQKNAKQRNIDWNLNIDEFRKLTKDKCYYCGKDPTEITSNEHSERISELGIKNSVYIHNGIDRKDPNENYNIDNCVTACKICNFGKHAQTEDQFIKWIENVYNYLESIGKIK